MSKGTKANSVDSGIGTTQEVGLADLMKTLIANQMRRDDQRDQERRDEQARREEERRDEQARREEERRAEQARRDEERESRDRARQEWEDQKEMFETIMDRTNGVDTSAPAPPVRLPILQDEGDLESFITSFGAMLK